MTSKGRQWFMWVICYKKKKLSFLYPVVLQVVCFWGQVVHVVKTMCVSTNNEVTMSEYFATDKKGKRQRCQIGCKVNVESTERNNRPGSNGSCKYFLFANIVHVFDWKLTFQHRTGVDAGDPHPRLVKTN